MLAPYEEYAAEHGRSETEVFIPHNVAPIQADRDCSLIRVYPCSVYPCSVYPCSVYPCRAYTRNVSVRNKLASSSGLSRKSESRKNSRLPCSLERRVFRYSSLLATLSGS